jgi:hypothetical protein
MSSGEFTSLPMMAIRRRETFESVTMGHIRGHGVTPAARLLRCDLTARPRARRPICVGPAAREVLVLNAMARAPGPRRQALLERVVAATTPRIAADEAPGRPLGGGAIAVDRKRRDGGQHDHVDLGHWSAPMLPSALMVINPSVMSCKLGRVSYTRASFMCDTASLIQQWRTHFEPGSAASD